MIKVGVAFATPFFFCLLEYKNMKVVPTLSSRGWAKTPEERIDRILTYYSALNPSQTLRFKNNVVSLQSAIFRAGGNMDNLARIIQSDLTKVFQRNFPEGAVVEVVAIPIDNSAKYDMNLSISVINEGKQLDVANVIPRIDSQYVKTYNTAVLPPKA